MPETWVVNASPVISLAKSGHLTLLTQLADPIILPNAVASEIQAGPPDDPARQQIESALPRRLSPKVIPDSLSGWALGPGETAVLALCMEHPGWIAVLDDAQARRCARTLGIPLIGTVGAILRARKAGLIPSAATVLNDLARAGMYIDPATLCEALKIAGEHPSPSA